MRRYARYFQSAAIVAVVTSFAISAGSAQSLTERIANGVKKLELGCAEDVSKLCSSVTPGDGRLFFCILAHEDKVSPKCDLALYDASRNLERALDRVEQVADACWADIERSCANVQAGGGSIL